ncbi:MAG: hypothetical protein V4654_01760 [Bdellovibrionota bacterium]
MINHVVPIEQNLRTFNIFHTLKIAFLPIFVALLVSGSLDQYINSKIEAILRSPYGLSQTIWVYGAVSIFSSLLFPLIITFFASFALARSIQDVNYGGFIPQSLKGFFAANFELSFLETIRAWGKTFLWTFLFIIPGIIKFFFYFPVPFVVFFSKRYQAGEVDALKLAQKIAKKHWFWLLIYMAMFTFILPMTTSLGMDQYRVFREYFVYASLLTAIDAVVVIVFHYYILKLILKFIKDDDMKEVVPEAREGT